MSIAAFMTLEGQISKIIVVSKGEHSPELNQWADSVIVSPAVFVPFPEATLGRKKLGILRAMRDAVELAEPGDLIIQEDIVVTADPFKEEAPPGTIRNVCAGNRLAKHVCPRAFIISDEATKQRLLDLWASEDKQSCWAWADIEKVNDYLVAVEGGDSRHG